MSKFFLKVFSLSYVEWLHVCSRVNKILRADLKLDLINAKSICLYTVTHVQFKPVPSSRYNNDKCNV